ncbi:hypothetical protein vBEcoMphAPEC6_00550 [Escherichia phage ph0011]|nr:hypothetical protein vBEcoMphAPEC6_00550 [Escherichia phage ph0011]
MNKKEQMESFMNTILRRFVIDIRHNNITRNDMCFGTYNISELYIANIHMVYRDYIQTLHGS